MKNIGIGWKKTYRLSSSVDFQSRLVGSMPFWRCNQYQIIHIKQTVDPEAPNSDTLVDSAATVYPIHIDYGE